MSTPLLLAIDEGTTSTRALLFRADGLVLRTEQREFDQSFPRDGWVEHDPEQIWQATLAVCRAALHNAPGPVVGIGITNQRETTVVWDRNTGAPVYPAIVWQDRRGAPFCDELRRAGYEPAVQAKTGLRLDSYFSATNIRWILDQVDSARARAENGELAFGTIDSFLLWRLTGGRVHATDVTNAARTLLFNIRTQTWDDDLLTLFDVPRALLPTVKDSAADYGVTAPGLLPAALPIAALVGDQHAAMIGQACLQPGMAKCTFGTGCFALIHTGAAPVTSTNRLLATPAYACAGETAFALEGSVFNAGTTIKWLRDELGIIRTAAETEALAASLPDNRGVHLVPAFTGLGAPHWDPNARGMLSGLTRDSGRALIVRAALEAVAYQVRDLLDVANADGAPVAALRVDGGMAVNNWLMQFLADVLDVPVERPLQTETTALGAALLAGLQFGALPGLAAIGEQWRRERLFTPAISESRRSALLAGWAEAVARSRFSSRQNQKGPGERGPGPFLCSRFMQRRAAARKPCQSSCGSVRGPGTGGTSPCRSPHPVPGRFPHG